MNGRKLNMLLGQDPDDHNFMDPNHQYVVCYWIQKKADEIKPRDSRLWKLTPAENVGATWCSRRVELLNPERKQLDEGSIQNIQELTIFSGGRCIFEDDVGGEEKAEEEALAAKARGGGLKNLAIRKNWRGLSWIDA